VSTTNKNNGEHGMELLDACMLSEGEEVIFDDGNDGRSTRLVLTNKRLIFLQCKGRINKTYKKEDEITIEDIESARYDTGFETIVLQLKNGEKGVIDFTRTEGFEVLMETDSDTLDVRLQAGQRRYWIKCI
jgi:hypothetical protein